MNIGNAADKLFCQEGWHRPALSFCQKNFSELKMQKAEHLFFRRCSALLYLFLWIYDAFFNFWAASGALC